MVLKDLINKSWYGSIGYIENKDSIDLLGSYLLHNKPVLDEFEGHIFAFTYKELDEGYLSEIINSLYPEATILYLRKNRGHNFGTADLDNLVFDTCKSMNIEWLCKTSTDIIFQPEVLELPIQEADFYYMNGIGYGGMVNWDFDFNKIQSEYFYPQTNFYFINVSKTDYINNKEYLDETYNYIQSIDDYNGKIWEYVQDWTCEDFLVNCVNRNNLSKCHLITPKTYIKLLELVKQHQIHDCSHKNILIDGVCHYQYPNKPIIII